MRRRPVQLFALVLVVLAALVGWIGTGQLVAGCHQDQHTWATLRRVIDAAYAPPPGFHLTAAERRLIAQGRRRVEAAQGDRPSC